MALQVFREIRQAIEQLNPYDVTDKADRPLHLHLIARSPTGYAAMEDFLAPTVLQHNKRRQVLSAIHREGEEGAPRTQLEIYDTSLGHLEGGFGFDPRDPEKMVRRILKEQPDLALPLARQFLAFRKPVTDKIIFDISKENALFAMATAMPGVIPGISLPMAIPEAATDATVLTVNQIRMAFLLAAASDHTVGYREQKAEIASIIAGCFGWRAIARELVGKIPFGGGILPKAAVAFAGTYVEGLSLERLYRLGSALSRAERKSAYGEAMEKGREVAAVMWEKVRRT